MAKYSSFLGLGIAGNFALHLAQAGELEDFKDVITADEAAPKGMFPFYLPLHVKSAKAILNTYPLSSEFIKMPKEDVNIQTEPEVGLVCEIEYEDGKVKNVIPKKFGAYNDCSIRVAGASKISDKKNWGEHSKGFSETLFEIDTFLEGGIMDSFSIASFLKRDGEVHAYGENVELNGYSYFYSQLTEWIADQINRQEEFGPLEPLSEYIATCNYPTNAIISIGATRYTHYGETTFLQENDELFVIVYNHTKVKKDELTTRIQMQDFDTATMSVLQQKVIR